MTRRGTILAGGSLAILVIQAIVSAKLDRAPFLPTPPPLSTFPDVVGGWRMTQDVPIEQQVIDMLGPDDYLNRNYVDANRDTAANLFFSYYRSQLRAKTAHDPKVCLPGSGWNPRQSKVVRLDIPGRSDGISVNYYQIARRDQVAVVLYWFQTHRGSYPAEQQLRFHRVVDAISDNRTDMALVRVVVPVDGKGIDQADAHALEFARIAYPHILKYFPPKP